MSLYKSSKNRRLKSIFKQLGLTFAVALLVTLATPAKVYADMHELHFYAHPQYSANISPITGYVNVSSETGAQTSFSAAPYEGFTFYRWVGKWPGQDDRWSNSQSTVMACSGLTEAHAYMVKNSDAGIVVSSADDTKGTVIGTRPWSWSASGQYFTISATPKDPTKYEFDHWEKNGKAVGLGASAEVPMPSLVYDFDNEKAKPESKVVYKAFFKEKTSGEHGFRAVTGNEGGSITAGAFVPYTTWSSSGTVTAVATPAEDYDVDCWLDPDGKTVPGSSKQKQINISYPSGPDTTKDLVYTVKFKKASVTGIGAVTKKVDSTGKVIGDGGGAVSPAYVAWSTGNRDQSITLTATPDKGMEFATWDMPKGVKYSGSITNSSISIVMPHDQPADDLVITAKFKADTKFEVYTEVAMDDGGLITPGLGGTVNPAMVTPESSEKHVSLTAEPYMGYEFEKWVDLDSEGKVTLSSTTTPTVTITVPAVSSFTKDVHIRAVFKPVTDVGIWALSSGGGAVSSRYTKWSDGNKGTSIPLSATPDAGYIFDCWSCSDGHTYTSQNISVTMPSTKMEKDIVYIAVFRKKSIIYTEVALDDGGHITEGTGGTVSPATIEPNPGNTSEVTLTATPASGYEFDHWEDMDSGGAIIFISDAGQPTVTISVPKQSEMLDQDIHIRAVFKHALDDGIWTLAQNGGTASPRYVKWSEQTKGTSITITATPNAGYEFDHWIYHNRITGMKVDSYSTAPSLSVKMPEGKMTDDIVYTAVFRKAGEIGIYSYGEEGGETSPRYVRWTEQSMGSSVTLTATPEAGYEFDHWKYYDEGTGKTIENYSKVSSLSIEIPAEKLEKNRYYYAVFKKINGKTKNKEIHVIGKKTGITDESFLNKWRTWIDPALKYVRSTIQSMASTRTAKDAAVYEGNKPNGNASSQAAADLKADIKGDDKLKHSQSLDNPIIANAGGFSVTEISGLHAVFTEGDGGKSESEAKVAVTDKYGSLYKSEVVIAGDIFFENEKGERVTSDLTAKDNDVTVVMGGINTDDTDMWMLLYTDSASNEFTITPVTDSASVIRFTLPDNSGGKITLISVKYN